MFQWLDGERSKDEEDNDSSSYNKKENIFILSLPGGGVLSSAELHIIRGLEKKIGFPLHKLLNCFITVSGGSIVGSSLFASKPKDRKEPFYTRQQSIDTFNRGARRIFSNSFVDAFNKRSYLAFSLTALTFGLLLSPTFLPAIPPSFFQELGKVNEFLKKKTTSYLFPLAIAIRYLLKGKSFYSSTNQEVVFQENLPGLTVNDVLIPGIYATMTQRLDGEKYAPVHRSYLTNSHEMAKILRKLCTDECTDPRRIYHLSRQTPLWKAVCAGIRPPVFDPKPMDLTYYDTNEQEKEETVMPLDGAYFSSSPNEAAWEIAKAIAREKGLKKDEFRIIILSAGVGTEPNLQPPLISKTKQVTYYFTQHNPTSEAETDQNIQEKAQRGGHLMVKLEAPPDPNDPLSPTGGITGLFDPRNTDKMEKWIDRKIISAPSEAPMKGEFDLISNVLKAIQSGKSDAEIDKIIGSRRTLPPKTEKPAAITHHNKKWIGRAWQRFIKSTTFAMKP